MWKCSFAFSESQCTEWTKFFSAYLCCYSEKQLNPQLCSDQSQSSTFTSRHLGTTNSRDFLEVKPGFTPLSLTPPVLQSSNNWLHKQAAAMMEAGAIQLSEVESLSSQRENGRMVVGGTSGQPGSGRSQCRYSRP